MQNNIFEKIRQWGRDRHILAEGERPAQGNVVAQLRKAREEVQEIQDGYWVDDTEAIKDGIGDTVVVLTQLADLCGLTIEECIEHAYNEIKDRKGTMVDGQFVKEAQ